MLRVVQTEIRKRTGVPLCALEAGVGPHVDDAEMEPQWTSSTSEVYYDTYTGLVLDPELVQKARKVELGFADSLQAWIPRTKEEAKRRMGRPPFGTRWLDCNKGDDAHQDYRSRLVVQETRHGSTIPTEDLAATSSSTPPLEVLRLFCSICMTWSGLQGRTLIMQFIDISRAHPHVVVSRDNVYTEAPPELQLPPHMCLWTRKNWYGMRDANQGFEFAVKQFFEDNGFIVGIFTPCIFRHPQKPLFYFVHGDDFVGVGFRGGPRAV